MNNTVYLIVDSDFGKILNLHLKPVQDEIDRMGYRFIIANDGSNIVNPALILVSMSSINNSFYEKIKEEDMSKCFIFENSFRVVYPWIYDAWLNFHSTTFTMFDTLRDKENYFKSIHSILCCFVKIFDYRIYIQQLGSFNISRYSRYGIRIVVGDACGLSSKRV